MYQEYVYKLVELAEKGALTFTIDIDGNLITAKDLQGQELINWVTSMTRSVEKIKEIIEAIEQKEPTETELEPVSPLVEAELKPIKKTTKKK